MNWQAIGAIGEVLGAIAVVVSLLYLAKQIRDRIVWDRTSTPREMIKGTINQFNVMFGPENVEVIASGFKSYSLLSPVEKLRFDHLMSNLFQYPEDSWRSYKAGLMSDAIMDNWSWYLKTRMFPYPGIREWWTSFKSGYEPGFQDWVGTIIEQTDHSDDHYGLMRNG